MMKVGEGGRESNLLLIDFITRRFVISISAFYEKGVYFMELRERNSEASASELLGNFEEMFPRY